ncbi:MAG: T9SS type A sorting domain-containing protein [Bacteroidota bacterium]
MRLRISIAFAVLFPATISLAQTDTTKFPWPDPPFGGSKGINGTFCEFRNTLSANHFHNGVDIGEPDGNPVYPSLDGVVYSYGTSATDGTEAYVRIKTNVGGLWKHISYVHIEPNPSLTVGQPVIAGVTVLGTIIAGQGHVHLTEREFVASENSTGAEINPIRNGGGLTPFIDTYSPVINTGSVQFRRAGSGEMLASSLLFGQVAIVAKVDERNGPGSVGQTQTNNGTYSVGYRIYSSTRETLLVNPPDNGVRFRFDRKPLDSEVGRVFEENLSSTSAHYYYVTNGSGASSVNSTRTVVSGSFDADALPEGSFQLFLFSEDTRGNRDSLFVPIAVTKKDLSPPSIPVLRSVEVDTAGAMVVTWKQNLEADLKGYRLSYAPNPSTWKFVAAESTLLKNSTSLTIISPQQFAEPTTGFRFLIRLQAADTVTPPNVSPASDVYLISNTHWAAGDGAPSAGRVLIVDGFDRFGGSGSWSQPTHSLASAYTILPNDLDVGSAANETVADGSIDLKKYRMVFWILGDESTFDRTFTSAEQTKVKDYLENGGKLFVTGSEVGWDLGRTHSASEPGDLSFYNNYLKASYVYDGTPTMTTATGVAGQMFEGYTFSFGQVFPEDYPDDINPLNGSVAALTYNATRDGVNPRIAAVVYRGLFGGGAKEGAVVYLSFPFESMTSQLQRSTLLGRVMIYFGYIPTSVADEKTAQPTDWSLLQNYPNPFNPGTVIVYRLPQVSFVHLKVYDVLGRVVGVLAEGLESPGVHRVVFDGRRVASGIYFYRLDVGGRVETRRMQLIK